MSLKHNILASYASQIYVTLIGIVTLPLYLKYMGAEAYGLVGFFSMLQVWFNLLDMGLTPTVARETARFQGGSISALSYRSLLRALQFIFVSVAFFGGGAIFVFSDWIAKNWLEVQNLPLEQVGIALKIMAGAIALRWISGLYRGCISGSENLVWLGIFNICIATIRFLGVLPVLMWWNDPIKSFFIYQVATAIIELTVLSIKSHFLFPPLGKGEVMSWSPSSLFPPIASVLRFSISIAFTSSVWVLVTQTDKLMLSKLLPLADYGYFTLAVLAASGIMMIGGPISNALMPRMARMHAEGSEEKLIVLYRTATQIVAAITMPASAIISLFPEQILLIWTGDAVVANHAAPLLRLYALGNVFLSISAFAYYLQFAYGDLRFHLIGSALFASILMPMLIWSTKNYGAVGAGYSWLITNALYFFFWIPKIHEKFLKGFHGKWMLHDLLPAALGSVFSSVVLYTLFGSLNEVSHKLLALAFSSVACLFSAVFCSSYLRQKVKSCILRVI